MIDKHRKLMFLFLIVLVAGQLYVVWELFAIFLLLAVVFSIVAPTIIVLLMFQFLWTKFVDRYCGVKH